MQRSASFRASSVTRPPAPDPDRIFFTSLWFTGHNNPRYAELLPRLDRLDAYLLRLPRTSAIREGSSTARSPWSASRCATRRCSRSPPSLPVDVHRRQRADPVAFGADRRRRRRPVLHGRARSSCCSSPNLARVRGHRGARGDAASRARRRQALPRDPAGDQPQLAERRATSPRLPRAGAGRHRRRLDGRVPAQRPTTAAAKGRSTTSTTCSSSGTRSTRGCRRPALARRRSRASASRQRVEGRDDIVLFGRLPREQALATAANFDLALYPRTKDRGSRPPRSASSSGSASRPSRTTTR